MNVFLRFPNVSTALQDATDVPGTAKISGLSDVFHTICNMVIILYICLQKFQVFFLVANPCCSFFQYFCFFRFRVIQKILMLRNRSFIVYGRIVLRIMKVLDLKEPWLFWCNFFYLVICWCIFNCPYISLFVFITKQYTQRINKNHEEYESDFKHKNDGQETFVLYMPNMPWDIY